MKPFVVLYATREGQTRRIAEHIAATIDDRGGSAHLENVRDLREPFVLDGYQGAILAASVHRGKHEPEMLEFVKRHRNELAVLPSAFVSVSLREVDAEDDSRAEVYRAKAAAEVHGVIDTFLAESGWQPKRVKGVAGALRYSQYNFLIRFVMKHIAKKTSMPTDSSLDYEFTDWKALDRFVDDVLSDHVAVVSAQGAPAPA